MTNEEIFDRISNLIKEQLHNKKIEVTVKTNIQEDLGIDSIALMEFIITLEDEFNLNIPDEDVEDIQTMGELVDYLSRRLKEFLDK
ncbi:acyl carrier protein [Streptococcus mutans]|uniref:acyl carrier protein n=1 Tax=Streptococcus mutans TaxID=1309 RepID=UPI000E47000B|nr:acyl carrier protein [Streptococcus mutans]RHA22620.1 acyl carrier protein [Streptococcus mutans]